MKKLLLLFVGVSIGLMSNAQGDENQTEGEGKKVASVNLENMDGEEMNTADLGFDGPVIISFWATWCTPCKKELNTINEDYEDLQDETGVNLVAISVDDERTKTKVPMYVNAKMWDYLVLMDTNGDFKRAMGVNNVPHTFLLDSDGNIVYSHNNYAAGDELELYEELRKLVEAEKKAEEKKEEAAQ